MAKLLQGNTPLLNPTNLFPNSDFSRWGSTQTVKTVYNVKSGDSIKHIIPGISFRAYNCQLSYISFSRNSSDGSLHIETDIVADTSSYGRINIYPDTDIKLNGNVTCSFMVRLVDKSFDKVSLSILNASGSMDNTYLFQRESPYIKEWALTRRSMNVSNFIPGYLIQIPNDNTVHHLSFDIKNPFVCEGLYAGVNYVSSLDVKSAVQFMLSDMSNISGRPWAYDTDCAGFLMDFTDTTKSTGTRIGACSEVPVGKTGSYFDGMNVYKNMRRCNLADNGTVNAYYGDASYKEDGSNGQVMVEIPCFYYKVIPISTQRDTLGFGTAIKKAEYWISDSCKEGFKVHPLFNVSNGHIRKSVFLSAFDGCTYDVSASSYNTEDTQNVDFNNDILASIAGARPTSGLTQTGATRAGFRKLAQKRGSGWNQWDIFDLSALQMLFACEYAGFDSQSFIGKGVSEITDNSSYSETAVSGSTVGNRTGNAHSTMVNVNGSLVEQTVDGKVSVSYRGIENPWGNIWNWVDGFNYHDVNGSDMFAYLANPDGTSTYADDTDNTYLPLGFQLATSSNTYWRYPGYDEKFDFMFLPAATGGTENGPISDKWWVSANGWRVLSSGGSWSHGLGGGSLLLVLVVLPLIVLVTMAVAWLSASPFKILENSKRNLYLLEFFCFDWINT